MLDCENTRVMHFGESPLLLRVGQTMTYGTAGHGSPHYVMLQCWTPRAAAAAPRRPVSLAVVSHPHNDTARLLQRTLIIRKKW